MILFAALLAVPAALLCVHRLRRIAQAFGKVPVHRVALRTVCFCLAWTCLSLAVLGVSWGSSTVAVQKNGAAVSMVFDISHSMAATDGAGGMSRLEASAAFAKVLLGRMDDVSVSVVLVKGDGVLALPLTHDFDAVRILLDSIAPEFMTAAGSSLGRGIKAAVRSFPQEGARSCAIWLFTDGDETDGSLEEALAESVRFGIPVTLIGFGTEQGAEVLAGDRRTRVHSALQAQNLRAMTKRVSHGDYGVSYIEAGGRNAAGAILSQLHKKESVAYERRPAERRSFFIAAALVLFALGMAAGGTLRGPAVAVAATLCLGSCSARVEQSAAILSGAMAYYRSDYPYATTRFLQVAEDALSQNDIAQVAQYNLSAVYLAQNQDGAAALRLQSINDAAPDTVRFAAHYNEGIIAFRNGDYAGARDCFRQALLVQPQNISAKINMELCAQQQLNVRNAAQEAIPVNEERSQDEQPLKSEVFSLMRQQEMRQWQSNAGTAESTSGDDY